MSELKTALVTGASSGIGEATVRELAQSGRKVLAIARREEKLKSLESLPGVSILPSDVRNHLKIVNAIQNFKPEILINNAGVGHGIDGLKNVNPELIQDVIDTNIAAPIKITATVLPGMLSRSHGHIVNIGSIAGLHTMTSALYGSTKSAIHLFSQNLRNELAGSGIRVTEICPGRVTSEFYQAAEGNREKLDHMGKTDIRELEPEDVAKAVLFALDAPSHVNIATIEILPTEQTAGGMKLTKNQGRN